MRYQRSILLAYACAYVLGSATSASAQSIAAKKQEEKITTLEEIVVTAQRRQENLQEVPIALTALTTETRETMGISTIQDITNFVPGLYYEEQLDRANIRGVGRVTNVPGSDPGVGLYVDGVYNSSAASLGRSSIFTDRVDVLRGPQGSLFGRNTTGGAISVVSRRANNSFGGEGRITYGTYDRKIIEGTVTTPITDWMRFRLTAAVTKQDDGYFRNMAPGHAGENEGGNQDDRDYVAVLNMDLGKSVDFTLRYSRQDQDRLNRFNATLAQPNYTQNFATSTFPVSAVVAFNYGARNGMVPNPLYNGTVSSVANGGVVSPGTIYNFPNPTTQDDRRLFAANVPTRNVLDGSDALTTDLTWHLSGADLKWIGGFVTYDYYSWADADGTGRDYYDYSPTDAVNGTPVRVFTGTRFLFKEKKDYWSNELQLVSSGNGSVQWAGALYQYHERYRQIPIATGFSDPEQTQLQTVYSRPALAVPTTVAGYAALTPAYQNPDGVISQQTGEVTVDTYAALGQVTWKALDTLSITAGGRVNRDQKEGTESKFAVMWDPSVLGGRALAFDNSAPLDCFVPVNTPSSLNSSYQTTINTATGAVVPLTAASTGYAATCKTRQFEKRTWDDWSGNLGVEWKPMDDMMVYTKYSRGYKSGAIRVGSFALDAETNPERSNNYELGIKLRLASRYQFNVSTFYIDYHDYQFPVSEVIQPSPGQFSTISSYTNLDKSKTYGYELESILNPWSTLFINANFSYLRTKILTDLYLVDSNDQSASAPDASQDRITLASGNVAQNVQGNEFPGQPRHKSFVNVSYVFNTNAGSLTPSFSWSWRGPVSAGGLTVSAFSRDGNSTPSYSTFDARISWLDAQKRYRVIAYAANVTNNETVNSLSAPSTVNGQVVQNFLLNPPRTYGMALYYYFGSDRH